MSDFEGFDDNSGLDELEEATVLPEFDGGVGGTSSLAMID